jgi:hypothetical protein
MLETVQWLILGIILMVLGVLIMIKLHGKGKPAHSILFSILEFMIDTVIGLFVNGWIAGIGTIAVIMVLIGLFMTLINSYLLIGQVVHLLGH